MSKKVDTIITRQKEVIAIVEYKSPQQFNTNIKKNKAIQQEIEVARTLKTKLIIATDTLETVWVNVQTGNSIKDSEGNEFKYNFNPKDENLQKIITEIIQSINDKNDRILPKQLIDPSELAKKIWQDIWSVSGATPENCLYTFVEIFIFKYLSDLNILRGTYSFYNLITLYEDNNEIRDVLQHYANIIRPKIKELFPENPIDKTTIINGTIFVSKDQKAVNGYSTVFMKILYKFANIIGFDKGFDKDEQKTIILAKANMLIYFCELIQDNPEYTTQFAELFNESFILKTHSILGTLSEPKENEYDLILTNPPYVTSGSSNLKEEIAKDLNLKNYYKINGMGIEGLFMEWIVRALKVNGKAFIVIPDGILYRQENLRQFILDTCFIDALISLPNKTFFTTAKKTYILAITKKNNIEELQINPVFTYLCSEIGESRDINRLEIEQNDLDEAVKLFNAFKDSKKYFENINDDKRCKILPIDWFEKNAHTSWVIESIFNNDTQFTEVGLLDTALFQRVIGILGLKKTEYAKLDTKNASNIPVFTATLKPVAYFNEKEIQRSPNNASEQRPHISFANDGDGTAGSNIRKHKKNSNKNSRYRYRRI